MAKVMNVVFGIGIAIMIFIVSLLGINVFYPRPEVDDFGCGEIQPYKLLQCDLNMTVGECNELRNQQDFTTETSEYQKCWDRYDDASRNYQRDFFLITSLIGFIAIVMSLKMFNMMNIASGTAFSGLALIVYGFMAGWNSTDDWIKFLISLVIMALITYFAIFVNKWYDLNEKSRKKTKK